MTVYLGDKAVGANTIVEKEVAKTKFGLSIDGFFGDVDENGVLLPAPAENLTLDLTGVEHIGDNSLAYVFYNKKNMDITVIADDVKTIGLRGFNEAFVGCNSVSFSCNKVEVLENNAFEMAFSRSTYSAGPSSVEFSFKSVKKITNGGFKDASSNKSFTADKSFPVLEELRGNTPIGGIVGGDYYFSSIKTIEGSTSAYSGTFYSTALGTKHIYLPYCTTATGYIGRKTSSYGVYLHFAIANQAAIEACDGYDHKFDALEIYFDLMLTITVEGISYARYQTMDGYTSWKDASGNLVYTDETAEPAVGTVVYSDAGTTQVGTVEGVA